MKNTFLTISLCFVFFLGKSQDYSDRKAALETIMKSNRIPGLTLTRISNGEISESFALGVKSLESNDAITGETIFSAASLSKPVFAYLVMQLVEEGVLDLDTPLASYYDYPDISLEKEYSLVTGKMVLSHTSGLPNWRKKKLKFINDPGEKYSYSGEGYVWLQQVIEYLTGDSLGKLAIDYVFRPLGMTRSSYVFSEEFENDFTLSHKSNGELREKIKIQKPNAAASLQTTSEDYAKFLVSLYSGGQMDPVTRDRMFKPVAPVEKNQETEYPVSWSLGLGVQETPSGIQIFQWGDNYTFKGFFTLNIRTGNGLIYLSNSENGLSPLKEIISLFLDDPQPAADWLDY